MIMYHWVFVLNTNNEGGLYFIHYQKQCVLISIVSITMSYVLLQRITSSIASLVYFLCLQASSSLANCISPFFKNKKTFITRVLIHNAIRYLKQDTSTFSNIPQNLSQFTSLWRYNSVNHELWTLSENHVHVLMQNSRRLIYIC